mmetsp:Transcript_62411/g.180926  ORF Transcript_62411/g.180926 Transcript_62411/m.180926 type:complete len:202 (+) Transcript_62411:1250-1855(+)
MRGDDLPSSPPVLAPKCGCCGQCRRGRARGCLSRRGLCRRPRARAGHGWPRHRRRACGAGDANDCRSHCEPWHAVAAAVDVILPNSAHQLRTVLAHQHEARLLRQLQPVALRDALDDNAGEPRAKNGGHRARRRAHIQPMRCSDHVLAGAASRLRSPKLRRRAQRRRRRARHLRFVRDRVLAPDGVAGVFEVRNQCARSMP